MVFVIHRHESVMGAHVSPHPEPPIHLLPYSIPLGCPRAPALCALLHASNLHWSFILHMVIYMFQCYSLNSSHQCLLPWNTKVCSLHLCLLPCTEDHLYHLSKFHIYTLICGISVSLSDLLHSV